MLLILFSRIAVAAVYLAGLFLAGALDVLAVTAGLAVVVAWLGRPAVRAVLEKRSRADTASA